MTTAPAWLVDAVFDALPLLLPPDEATTVAAEISDAVWWEVLQRSGHGRDWIGFLYDTLPNEPRVIPSRTTDPATSHAADRAIGVKAGTQRAYLLESFWISENHEWGRYGLTDEEAMSINANVHFASEYSKRCSELREAGYIEPTGETRTGSSGLQRIVSKITERGRAAVRSL